MTAETIDTDILIIGGGIAGPALACALRNSGLRITLLEKSDAPADTARGDHLQPMSCEILERWGVLQDVFDNGAEKRLGSIWMKTDGEVLMNSSIADLHIPHPYFTFLNHERISETFMGSAQQSSAVRLIRPIRNWWLEAFEDDFARVRVGAADGEDINVNARLLVGADGRASRTRKLMNVNAEIHRYVNPISVLFADNLDRDPTNSVRVFVDNSRMISVIPRTGGGSKIGIPMSPDQVSDWRRADPKLLADRLREMIPALDVANVRFGDAYPPVYLRTEHWTKDNVVLIGDACHAMHPARSQGMNIAIRCIDKLSAIISQLRQPLSAPDIRQALTMYENEIKPGIDPVLRENHRNGLEMDSIDPDRYEKLMESLRSLQSNPQALEKYSMRAAGYTT